MKTRLILRTLLIAMLIASCGGTETQTGGTSTVVKVVTQLPSTGSGGSLTVSGQVAAVNNATLSTRVMGFVSKVHVGIGEKISKGQLLVSINSTDLLAKRAQVNAGINQAMVGLTNAKRDYDRFTILFSQNSASQKELDDITAKYDMARAQLESARAMKTEVDAQLSYFNITAPFSGLVTNKFVENGDLASPGMPLMAIEAPGAFEVHSTVPASFISEIKNGQEVTVIINAINLIVQGKVEQVGSSSSRSGGQFPIKILLDKNEAVKSGMYATVRFPVNANKAETDLVMISKDALVTQGDLQGVYTLSLQNTAMLRWLRIGETFGKNVEVLSGLNAEEAYIISSEGKLYNGVKVATENSTYEREN